MTFAIRKTKFNDTIPFKFPRLSLDPEKPITLHTRHLGVSNEKYMAAAFARGLDLDTYKATVDQDLQDLANYCVDSWENVVDENGKPAECSPEKVLAFLRFCVAQRFDDEINSYRFRAKVQESFRAPLVEVDALGKK